VVAEGGWEYAAGFGFEFLAEYCQLAEWLSIPVVVITAKDPTPEEMEASVARDIEQLQGLQNYDGGFPYWRRGRDSIPYNTVHVAHALQMARLKGKAHAPIVQRDPRARHYNTAAEALVG